MLNRRLTQRQRTRGVNPRVLGSSKTPRVRRIGGILGILWTHLCFSRRFEPLVDVSLQIKALVGILGLPLLTHLFPKVKREISLVLMGFPVGTVHIRLVELPFQLSEFSFTCLFFWSNYCQGHKTAQGNSYESLA